MKSSQQDKYSILSRESEADIIRNDGITLWEGTVRAHPAEKLLFADEPHPRRPRCQYCGEMIQMNASLHPWFGRSKTTSIPQAKSRIERLFQTLQSRLPIELRLAGISTLEQTNEFLASYLKEFNAQFALDMDCTRSVFEKQPDADKITQFLAVLTPRKIDAGHCIRFRNKYYALADEQGCQADFYKGTAAIVIRTLSGKLYVYAMAGKEAQ